MLKNVFKGTAVGLIAKAVSAIGSFLIIPLMLQKLGTNNYGIWITITSTIGLINFMDLGIGFSLMNYIAKAGKDEAAIISYINIAYRALLIFIGALLIIFVLSFSSINWKNVLNLTTQTPDVLSAIFITFCLFCFSLITNVIYFIQRGLQRSDIANLWQLINSTSYLLCLVAVLKFKPELKWIALVTFGVPVLISIINTLWFLSTRKLLHIQLKSYSLNKTKAFISNGLIFSYLQFGALIAFQTDALILAHTVDFEAVSMYSVTAKLFSIPAIILTVYSQALWPAYTGALTENNWTWIRKTFYNTVKASCIIIIVFLVMLFFMKEQILRFWLKNTITIPAGIFVAFSVWAVVNHCFDSPIAILLNGLNMLRVQIISSVLMITSNVFLSIYLATKLGVSGVIWGSSISTICFSSIPLFIYIQKHFRVNIAKQKFGL